MKAFFATVAAAHLVLADETSTTNGQNDNDYFSPATGVFTCSGNWGDILLLNDQAVQNCHIVIDGFAQNGIDSEGSVLFSSTRPNATLSLTCEWRGKLLGQNHSQMVKNVYYLWFVSNHM